MSQWINDQHGLIKLPTPNGGYGVDRRVNVSLDSGFRGQAHAPQRISGLAIGLGPVAGALGNWGEVLAKQEERKQKSEVIDWTQGFQDRERDMFAEMEQMKSQLGMERAVAFAKQFYETENPQLLKMARSDFQKDYLHSFTAQSRDSGLNRAFAFQSRQIEVYQDQVWKGETANTLAKIEANPENLERYLAELEGLDRFLNPGDDPAFRAAKAQQWRDVGLEAAVMALGRQGRFDQAEQLLSKAFGPPPSSGENAETPAGGLTSPLAGNPRISSAFGPRPAPMTPRGRGSSNHQGIDYAVPVGTPVVAAGDGLVKSVGPAGGYGLRVVIGHADGSETYYGHLSDASAIKVGDKVSQGQQIALSGNSGKSTGPHLDFKIKGPDGHFIDPQKALSGAGPAKADVLRKKLHELEDDAIVKTLGDEVAAAYQTGSEVEIATQIRRGFDEVAKESDPERLHRLASRYQQEINFHQTRRDAGDMEATENFLSKAAAGNWSPNQMKAELRDAPGFSREGKAKLEKQIDDGTVHKSTPANREATDRLMAEIDYRRRSGEPMSNTEIEAKAQQLGLTVEQINSIRKYSAEGGMEGHSGLAGRVSDIFKELAGGKENAPPGFIKLVAQDLPSGKEVSPDDLRKAVARRLWSTLPGESMGAGWWWDTDETYAEAIKAGRENTWLPDVSSDEQGGIDVELMAAGLPVNSYNRRLWKKSERLGLPLSKEELQKLEGMPNG
jgi:murein DD-endopeptidase MepM/ murein hydrolase activator NlpD